MTRNYETFSNDWTKANWRQPPTQRANTGPPQASKRHHVCPTTPKPKANKRQPPPRQRTNAGLTPKARKTPTTNQPHQNQRLNKHQPSTTLCQRSNAGLTPKASKRHHQPTRPKPKANKRQPPPLPANKRWPYTKGEQTPTTTTTTTASTATTASEPHTNEDKTGTTIKRGQEWPTKHQGQGKARHQAMPGNWEAGRRPQRTQTAKEEGQEEAWKGKRKRKKRRRGRRRIAPRRRPEAQNATQTMSRSCRGQLDKRKQKPQSTKRQTPQDKRQRNHAREEDEHPKTAQQTNTNSSDQHQRTIANHSTKRKRNTTQGAGPPKQQNKRHPRRSRSPKTLKDRRQPQPATNTNRCGQKPGSAKRNAHRNDQTARRKPRAIKCSSAANAALSLLHRRGRGDGGCSSGTNP